MNIIFQPMKTIGKSTGVPEWPQTLAVLQANRFGHRAHRANTLDWALELSKVWWLESTTERTLSAPCGLLVPSSFLTLAHVSRSVHLLFTALVATRLCRCLLRSDYMWAVMPWRLRHVISGSWLGESVVPAWCFVALLTFKYDLVILLFFPLFLLPYHVKMIQCYHSCIDLPWTGTYHAFVWLFCLVFMFCFCLVGLLLVFVFGLLWLRDSLLDYAQVSTRRRPCMR